MAEYDNSGILSKAKTKKTDKSPDYTGSITVEGKKYSLAGWNNKGSKGPFVGLRVKPWDDSYHKSPPKPQSTEIHSAMPDDDFEDSTIPF